MTGRRWMALATLACAALVAGPRTASAAWVADPSFQADTNAPVLAIALQADGKVLLGGNFTQVAGQPRSYLARLHPDGSLDDSFRPALALPYATAGVRAISVRADGKIWLGGGFSQVNGQAQQFLARLNADGSLDTSAPLNANGEVFNFEAQPHGGVMTSGWFTQVLMLPIAQAPWWDRLYVARLLPNGAVDTGFVAQGMRSVYATATQPDERVVLGGDASGSSSASALARVLADGTADASFTTHVDGTVRAMAPLPGSRLLLGGQFTQVGGTPRANIARLDAAGQLDTAFNPGANNWVRALQVLPGGQVLMGGSFTEVGGQPRARLARLNADGAVDADFDPGANSHVVALAVQPDGKVLAGGFFTEAGGLPRLGIVRLQPQAAPLPPGGGPVSVPTLDMGALLLLAALAAGLGGQALRQRRLA